MGNFNKEGQIKIRLSFSKSWPRKFCNEMFYKGYKIFDTNAKIVLDKLSVFPLQTLQTSLMLVDKAGTYPEWSIFLCYPLGIASKPGAYPI